MNMKNEHATLAYLKAIINSLDHQTKVPTKVFLSSVFPGFEINRQKLLLAELKKNKLIKNYTWEDGDFVITKPSRSGMIDFLHRLERPVILPEATKPIDTALKFDEKTGFITMGAHKPCPIVVNSHHYFVCKLLFRENFGTRVTETDILDQIDYAKESKRRIYDAMRAVNKKIKAHFGIDRFIQWRTGRVWIDYRQM
jgi:hypothetical protein